MTKTKLSKKISKGITKSRLFKKYGNIEMTKNQGCLKKLKIV